MPNPKPKPHKHVTTQPPASHCVHAQKIVNTKCKLGQYPPCYVLMARVARLEWVLGDGYLGVRIGSEL
jgi:hypothetical protein